MPRINQRFLLALIVIGAVLGGVLYGAYVFQASRQTDFFLEQADKAVEEGRIEKAANLYRRVLEHEPENPSALGKMADCLDRMGKHVDAYIAYETASRAASDPDRYLTRQIELAIRLKRWRDAESLLARGLEKSPDDPQLLLLMAQSLYRQGNANQAVETFHKVLATDDPPQEAYFLLAIVLSERQRRGGEAEAVIEKLLANHPDEATAHVFAAQWYLEQLSDRPVGDSRETPRVKALREKNSQCVQAALRLDPDDRSVLQVGLQEARLRRDETAVMELAERGASRHPDEPAFYEYAAESAFRQGQPKVAADWLKRGLQQNPSESTLLWDYVGLKLDRKEVDEAEGLVARYGDKIPAVVRGALSGRILVARRRWKSALNEFNEIASELTSRPQMARVVCYEQATCHGQLRQYDRQIRALRRALDIRPFWVQAREELARALYASGRTDEAVEELKAVIAGDQLTAASGLLMARLLIAQMSRRDAGNADWAEVETFLGKLDAGGVSHEEIVRLRCGMLVAMKQLDEAERYARREIEKSPSLPANLGLALIQSERGEWDAALATIRRAAQKFGDSVEVRRAEAVCLLAARKANPSRLRELTTPPADWSAQQKNDLAEQLLPVVLSSDQLDLAEELVESLIANRPNAVSYRIEYLNIANRRNDADLAASILTDIERLSGRTAYWHYGRAVRIWTSRRDGRPLSDDAREAAFHHLSEAGLERPSWAKIPLLHAMLLDSAGNSESAISKYDQAIALGVRDPQVIRRLVDLLIKARRFEEADVTLRRLSEQIIRQSENAPTLRIASEMSFHLARFENAVRLADKAAEQSGAAEDYLWLARLLELQDRNAEAGSAIAKAVELAPLSETIRLEQIRFLIRDGRTDDAADSVAEFAQALNRREHAGSSTRLALAECYLAVGDEDNAAKVLAPLLDTLPLSLEELKRTVRVLVSLKEASPGVPAVGDYLQRILADSSDQGIQIWARREAALIAARNIRQHDFETAMALVKENLAIEPDSTDDIRAKALVLAAWPNAQRREEAISILEKLNREGELLSTNDRFLLAQLYIVRGQWVLGSRLMRQILAVSDQQTEQRMKFYANALIAHGEAQDGLLWTEKLLSSHPSAEAVRLHARALMAGREIDRLLKLLPPGQTTVRFADEYRKFLTPRDSAEILGRFTEKLIASDRKALAARVVERCKKISQTLRDRDTFPGSGIARVLASTGRLNEAFDILEQTATSGSNLDLVQYVEAILAHTDLSAADADRLHKFVSAESERRNDPPDLLLAKAQIQEKMEDFDGAIASYRQLIAADAENAAALNNLAFLLALRGEEASTAVTYAKRVMKRTGPVPAVLDTYAVTLIANDKSEQAVELLGSLSEQNGLPASHFHQAWAYFKLGNENAARTAMLQAGKRGLRKESLHPLEVPIYNRLRSRGIRLAK